jgi:2-amino-4-hydroxy-6-hydroxymethyldihydropteridine diphosphokinase
MTALAYIALGANVGDRAENIRVALEKLKETPGVDVTKVSAMLENPAVGGPVDSPPFLNAAAEVATSLPADMLLARLLEIEQEMGRVRREKWGPRPIDLDLLLYGDLVLDLPGLTVPHPLMHKRRFVLSPLVEIAPDAVHPVFQWTVEELLEDLNHAG